MENYDLEHMGIYDLRQLGRRVGVKSPTTMKKRELITQIKAINSGNVTPYRATRGRPPLERIEELKTSALQNHTINLETLHKMIVDFESRLIKLLKSE